MHLLALYDIAHPRRLYRVAKIMKDYGIRVQQSKFEIEVTEYQFSELQERIAEVISAKEDGVKYIPLCERCRHKTEVIGQGQYIDPDYQYLVI